MFRYWGSESNNAFMLKTAEHTQTHLLSGTTASWNMCSRGGYVIYVLFPVSERSVKKSLNLCWRSMMGENGLTFQEEAIALALLPLVPWGPNEHTKLTSVQKKDMQNSRLQEVFPPFFHLLEVNVFMCQISGCFYVLPDGLDITHHRVEPRDLPQAQADAAGGVDKILYS